MTEDALTAKLSSLGPPMNADREGCVSGRARFSVGLQRQTECRHLLAVSNEQDVAGQHRMIPRLAFDGPGFCEFLVLIWGCAYQRQSALFRDHEQDVLTGQQEELAVAVASALPLALAVVEIDARKNVAVEAERMSLVNHEVVEVRLEPVRSPALLGSPRSAVMSGCETARSTAV